MGKQDSENSQIQEGRSPTAMSNEGRQHTTLGMSESSRKSTENKEESQHLIRVVPIVMHDGKIIGGENKFSENKTESSYLQSNRKFETTEMQVESNMHVQSSEIKSYVSQNDNPNTEVDNKREHTDQVAGKTEKDSTKGVNQKEILKYNQVQPAVKSTKYVQKSKLETSSNSSDREQILRGSEPNESSIHSYIYERDHSLQDLQREVRSIRQSIENLQNYPNGKMENEHFKKQTYRSSTLPPRSMTPTSMRNSKYNIYNSPQTSRKSAEQFPPKHYVGHSSVSLETLNSKNSTQTPHFGFFPKPETRPGSITPSYVKPLYYRSARNLTRGGTSEQNKETTQRSNNYSEPHLNYCTLPRMPKTRNKRNSGQFKSIGNKYYDDSFNKDSQYEWINFRGRGVEGNGVQEESSGREINIIREKLPSEQKSKSNGDLKAKNQKESKQPRKTGTVHGVPRKQSNLDELNPFLVNEEAEDDHDEIDLSNPSATDEYWTTLNKKATSKSDIQEQSNVGSDAGTQTIKNEKKSGCTVM